MDIFDHIREQLLVEQEELQEGIKRTVKKILKDPLKTRATRAAYKRVGNLKKKLGIEPGQIFYIGQGKNVDSIKRAQKVLKKRTGQMLRRSLATGVAAGTGAGVAHRKRKDKIDESIKGLARRVTKKLKDPLRKKAYKRASDLEGSLDAQIYHLRRAGKSGVAKPETVKKLRKKLERNRERAGWVKAKAFYPKQMKGKTVFDRR